MSENNKNNFESVKILNIFDKVLGLKPSKPDTQQLPRPAKCERCNHITNTNSWFKGRCSKCGKTFSSYHFSNPLDIRQFKMIPVPNLIFRVPSELNYDLEPVYP